MVSPEELGALDLMLWLRTGQLAAQRLGCTQSTVSRRVAHCSATFNLKLSRGGGEWQLRGHQPLLAMERRVHQVYRLLGKGHCGWNAPRGMYRPWPCRCRLAGSAAYLTT